MAYASLRSFKNDTATGSHIWAERYDRDLTDVFAVQDEITDAIVTAMRGRFTQRRTWRRQPAPDSVMRGTW